MQQDFKWWANNDLRKRALVLGAHIAERDGGVTVIDQIVLRTLSKEEVANGEAWHAGEDLELTKESANDLMDALWALGVRPTHGDGNVGQLAATKAHLEDMRTLVFKKGVPVC